MELCEVVNASVMKMNDNEGTQTPNSKDPLGLFLNNVIKEEPQEWGSEDMNITSASSETVDAEPLEEVLSKRIKLRQLYSMEVKQTWNMKRVIFELGNQEQCIAFAESRNLIPIAKQCTYHRCQMSLSKNGAVGKFKCFKNRCRKPNISRSTNTWFENLKLPLPIFFHLMYCYANDYTYSQTRRECCNGDRDSVLSEITIRNWYDRCRETIVADYKDSPKERPKIGGPGKVVSLDECKLRKRQFVKGSELEGRWVLALIENGSADVRVVVCPANIASADVLISIIKGHVEAGSTIHTDLWDAYDCLSEHGFVHRRVSEKDPERPCTKSQSITKNQQVTKRGAIHKIFDKVNNKENFADWMIEFAWRQDNLKNRYDNFEQLIKSIANVYTF